MANGTAIALKLIAPEPQTTVPASGMEAEIGEAMVSAACAGWRRHAGIPMPWRKPRGAVKSIGGERIAKLVHLQMATEGQLDFSAVAIREGKRRLRAYLDAEPGFRQRHGPEGGEKTLDIVVEGALEIVANVVKFEKVLAAARAN